MKAPKNTHKYQRRHTFVYAPSDTKTPEAWRCANSNQYRAGVAYNYEDRNDEYLSHYISQKSGRKTPKHIPIWIA